MSPKLNPNCYGFATRCRKLYFCFVGCRKPKKVGNHCSRLLYLLAWTVINVGGPNRSWRLCVLDWCTCVLQIRCALEELQLSFYYFRDSRESVRCEYNLDHHWQLWRAYLSTRREIARAVYSPPVTAVWCPSVTSVTLLAIISFPI